MKKIVGNRVTYKHYPPDKLVSIGDEEELKKIEDIVVLTREEYKELKFAADHFDPFWFCTFGGCEGARKECKDTCEMSIFVQERRKTAREIIQTLKDKVKFGWTKSLDITCREIEEKYGLEVEDDN